MPDYDPDDLLKTTDLDDLHEWLEAVTEAIDDGEYEPTAWEEDFLQSISERVETEIERWNHRSEKWLTPDDEEPLRPLTGPQLASLRGIYDKVKE